MYKALRCFIIAIAGQTFLHKAFLLLATPFLFGNYKILCCQKASCKKVELRGLNMWAQLEHTPTDTKFKV